MNEQEVRPMLREPQIKIIKKLLDALEGKVLLSHAGLQEQTHPEGLAEIRHAKNKLSSGDYGVCERCNLTIAAAPLMLDPLRRECEPCAETKRPRKHEYGPGGLFVARPAGHVSSFRRNVGRG